MTDRPYEIRCDQCGSIKQVHRSGRLPRFCDSRCSHAWHDARREDRSHEKKNRSTIE